MEVEVDVATHERARNAAVINENEQPMSLAMSTRRQRAACGTHPRIQYPPAHKEAGSALRVRCFILKPVACGLWSSSITALWRR